MTEPIAFISHFRSREADAGTLDVKLESAAAKLESAKPRTAVFLVFLDSAEGQLSILHVFPDADAADSHFADAAERAESAYEYIEPMGWEAYGPFSDTALATLKDAADRAGAPFRHRPAFVTGFMRMTAEPAE